MGSIPLPAGAAGLPNIGNKNPEAEKVAEESEKSVWQSIAELPGNLYDAFTGDDELLEYPNIPESTELVDSNPDFLEGLLVNAKIMFARDDKSKAEIIENQFKDNEKFGGIYSDKFDNPMIVWNDKPYYVNKPGFSGQDIGTFIGEIVKFLPATKFVSGASNVFGTAARGVPAYSATELAGTAAEKALAPETSEAKADTLSSIGEDVAISTGVGVATDIALPPVLKGAGKAIRATGKATGDLAKLTFPKFSPAVDAMESAVKTVAPAERQTSAFPLTQGQRTAPLPDRKAGPTERTTEQLETEDVMRRAPSTDPSASGIIRGFDQNQLDQIRGEAKLLQDEFGSGRPEITSAENVPMAAAEEIKSVVSSRAASLKQKARRAYETVKGADQQPVMTREGVLAATDNALNRVVGTAEDSLGITQRELARMPLLNSELKYLRRVNKLAQNPRFKGQPLTVLHGYQKSINRAFRSAEDGSPEKLAIGRIKSEIDKAVFDGIEAGFLVGDEEVLKQLKNATGLYKEYMGLTGQIKGTNERQRAASKILEKITNPDYDPKDVVNVFFGHAKFNPNAGMRIVLNRLKNSLPEEEYKEVVALAKDAVLEKAFSGSGKSGVTRTNIVNNYDDVFVKNKAVTDILFNKKERDRIKKFREDVMPTLWAEIKLNPSGSGYTVLSGLAKNGLLNYARLIPMVGTEAVTEIQRRGAVSDALSATRQFLNRTNRPMFSDAVQSAIRPTAVEDEAEEASSPALQSIIQSAPKTVLEKLNTQN